MSTLIDTCQRIFEILHDDKLPQCEQISLAITKLGELRENDQAAASKQLLPEPSDKLQSLNNPLTIIEKQIVASMSPNGQQRLWDAVKDLAEQVQNAVEQTDENSGLPAFPVGCRFLTYATRFMSFDKLQVALQDMTSLQTAQDISQHAIGNFFFKLSQQCLVSSLLVVCDHIAMTDGCSNHDRYAADYQRAEDHRGHQKARIERQPNSSDFDQTSQASSNHDGRNQEQHSNEPKSSNAMVSDSQFIHVCRFSFLIHHFGYLPGTGLAGAFQSVGHCEQVCPVTPIPLFENSG